VIESGINSDSFDKTLRFACRKRIYDTFTRDVYIARYELLISPSITFDNQVQQSRVPNIALFSFVTIDPKLSPVSVKS